MGVLRNHPGYAAFLFTLSTTIGYISDATCVAAQSGGRLEEAMPIGLVLSMALS
jgi:hypothetical protein